MRLDQDLYLNELIDIFQYIEQNLSDIQLSGVIWAVKLSNHFYKSKMILMQL